MAMTNVQIIETEKMLRGIKEEIHTFERWKALGYSVKKGAKSEIKFAIWKYTDGKKKDKETGEETINYTLINESESGGIIPR